LVPNARVPATAVNLAVTVALPPEIMVPIFVQVRVPGADPSGMGALVVNDM
jgi:hypothetical protein